MKGVCAVGLSHKTARVDVRERFALDAAARRALAATLSLCDGIAESVIVSTCNRTEVYAAGKPGVDETLPGEIIRDALLDAGRASGASSDDFRVLHGRDAVSHAFAVAAGLDSMVLGEPQILGQVREAYQSALAEGFVGPAFRQLFPTIFKVAKKAHTETAISEGQASVGSIAVELAAKVFDDLPRRTVLLLGAGETGETIAVSLHDRKVARLLIAGRGAERSSRLAERFSGVALSLENALSRLHEADIVLAAASVPDGAWLVTSAMLEAAVDRKRGAPLLVVDVGVPRNVEPAARDLADLFLYDLDDLGAVAEETHRRRKQEVRKVEAILTEGVASFAEWWGASQGVAPFLRDLHAQVDATRLRELERTLARLPAEHHAAIERFSRSLADKLLQRPTIEIRKGGESLREKLDLLRKLFGLDSEDESDSERDAAADESRRKEEP